MHYDNTFNFLGKSLRDTVFISPYATLSDLRQRFEPKQRKWTILKNSSKWPEKLVRDVSLSDLKSSKYNMIHR